MGLGTLTIRIIDNLRLSYQATREYEDSFLFDFAYNTLHFVVRIYHRSWICSKKWSIAIQKKRSKVDVSDIELRLRLTDYFIRFSEDLEKTADAVYFGSRDREVKKAALMWKIYGISAMSKAVNMPDPIASFYNAWPLAKQMIIFLNKGKAVSYSLQRQIWLYNFAGIMRQN